MPKGQININKYQLESLCKKLYTTLVLGGLIDQKSNSNDTYNNFCFLISHALENLTDIETVVDDNKWTIGDNVSAKYLKELSKTAKLKGAKTLHINPFSSDISINNTELNNAN